MLSTMIIAAFNVFLHTVCVCFPLFWMVGIELLIYSNGKNLFSMLMSFCAIKCDEWIRSIDSIFFPPVRLFFLMFFFQCAYIQEYEMWIFNFNIDAVGARVQFALSSLCVFFFVITIFSSFFISESEPCGSPVKI